MKRIKERISPLVPLLLIGLFILLFISIVRHTIFGQVKEEKHLFFEISFLLLLAVVAEMAVVYLKQPSVVLLLLLGMLISNSFLEALWAFLRSFLPFLPQTVPHFVTDTKIVHVFGQLGAIFILLKVGLHVKFGKIFNLENGVVAFLGILVPFLAGYGYALFSGGSLIYGLFLGAALTATSVGITIALLKEAGLIGSKFADVILGTAIIDDVLGLLVLSFVTITSSNADINQLLLVITNTLLFIAGGVLAGRYFVKKFIDKNEFNSKALLVQLAFAFVYAYIAEYIGLSSIVGAFLAGIVLNSSRHRELIDESTQGIELIFAPIFFISLGMLVDVSSLITFALPIIIITLIAIASKFVGCGLGGLLIGLKPIESAIVGIGMAPRGEVALIVGLIGLTKGVLSTEQYTIIATMAFLTTFLMPFLIGPLLKRV